MDARCRNIESLLPWYLTAALGEDESVEVRDHLKTCRTCRNLLRETREALDLFTEHVDSEELVAWVLEPDSVDARQHDVIESHIAHCSSCASEVSLIREDSMPGRFARHSQWRSWGPAAAAALVVIVAGLGWLMRETPNQLIRPEARPATLDSTMHEPLEAATSGALLLDGFEDGKAGRWLVVGIGLVESEGSRHAGESVHGLSVEDRGSTEEPNLLEGETL